MIYCVLLCGYCDIGVIYETNKCFKEIDLPPLGSLTASEFEQARLKLIKVMQQKSFPQAFAKLKDQDKFEDPANFLQESV